MNQNKMSGKDYIACGIFSALCMVAMLIGAVMNIVVSHDIEFLNDCCTGILELDKITKNSGNVV